MNKKDKQYRWKDVTGECRPNVTCGSGGAWFLYNHKCGTLQIDGTCSGRTYRWRWAKCRGGPECEIRIERRVEVEQPKPEFTFTYTPEFVKALDCGNMSDESVLVHCVDKWDEVVKAHEAGVTGAMSCGAATCPACLKYGWCSSCPLSGPTGACCGNTHKAYICNPCAATAAAVRGYIQGKLDEIRGRVKVAAWVPKVGDRVRDRHGNEGKIVFFSERGQVGVENKTIGIYGESASDLTLIEAAK